MSLLLLPLFVSGCRANFVGKYNDYNEIFTGTLDIDMYGGGTVDIVTYPSNVVCKGEGKTTYFPPLSLIGVCSGTTGVAEINCNDGRIFNVDWKCQKWVRITGTATTNTDEKLTFYAEKSKRKYNSMKEKYITDVEKKPLLPKRIFENERLINSENNELNNLF